MAKVMISLPDKLLREVDRSARAQSRSRSELIREALRAHLSTQGSSRDWKQADEIRRRLLERGVSVADGAEGPQLKRKERAGA